MTDGDLAMVREWRNSERVRPYMFTTHEITPEEHVLWWDRTKADPSVRYYVFEVYGRPVGIVNVVGIDRVNGLADWGYYLGVDDAPRGSGGAMEYCALEEVFERLGVRKLVCQVFVDNPPPLRLHEKFGFKQEGYRKAHRMHNETYTDIVELALFAEDWPKVAEEMAPRVFRD